MIDKKSLFKKYNLKTWKQSKFQIFLSILAISISVAVLLSLKLILALNDSYTTINARRINDGDINIQVLKGIIDDNQLNILNEFSSEKKLHFATTYKIQNNFTNGQISNTVEVKFIDSNYSYINEKVAEYDHRLGNHRVIINREAADKFGMKIGDVITLNLRDFSDDNNKFKVQDIIENTNVLDESILGVIILDKSDLSINNNMKREGVATNINIIIDKGADSKDIVKQLKEVFSTGVSITTSEEGIKSNKNLLNQEKKASDFIQVLIVSIAGIGICFTTLLLILKRKKDYVLLSIYGMKEDLLKKMILYETFIICSIGIVIGAFFSFIIAGFLAKNILFDMNLYTIVKVVAFPFITTILFVFAQTMIFTILPIRISKQIEPNSILRQQIQKLNMTQDYGADAFKMISLMIICFSIYIRSIKNGAMYICMILILITALYGVAIGGISLIIKIKNVKNKYFLLALRNINRQKNRFAFCIVALITTLILCGLFINLTQTILPNILKQVANDSGYNLSVTSDFDEKNLSNVESVLSGYGSILNYTKTIRTTGTFKELQGKSIGAFIKDKKFSEENEKSIEDFLNSPVKLQALNIESGMLKYETMLGSWFSSRDINKNYVVLGENFAHLGINIDDEIDLDIQGKVCTFRVLGICTSSNFRDNSAIYFDIKMLKGNSFINANSRRIEYLIQCDDKNQKSIAIDLTKKLRNSLILDINEEFNQVNKYIKELTYVFIYICFISIFSALCLIGNILMIINFERIREFLILNVIGAKNKDIRKITAIEGMIIGGLSGITGSLFCEFMSYSIVKELFSSEYTANLKVDIILTIISIILTVTSSLIVISNLNIEKSTELLRIDQ